jgi:hypothetical protein
MGVETKKSYPAGEGETVLLPWTPYQYSITTSQFVTTGYDSEGWPVEAAWNSAGVVAENIGREGYVKNGPGNADLTGAAFSAAAKGSFRSIWDGPVLYFRVDVEDPSYNTNVPGVFNETDNQTAGPALLTYSDTANAAGKTYAVNTIAFNNTDGVEFRLDLWNQKLESDHAGSIFWIARDGTLYGVTNNLSGIPTYGGVDFWEGSPWFTNRMKAWKVVEKPDHSTYSVYVALEIGGMDQKNGMAVALDICIADNAAGTGNTRTSRAYWSHYDNAYTSNTAASQDMNKSLDWGCVVLNGRMESAAFARSTWLLRNYIRWIEAENPETYTAGPAGGVVQYLPKNRYTGTGAGRVYTFQPWTGASWDRLEAALNAGKALLINSAATQAQIDTAAQNLFAAIMGLERETDKSYANPYDLERLNTLPNPYTFKFGPRAGQTVKSIADWRERREEILDMAQYYEYGYKPPKPDFIEVPRKGEKITVDAAAITIPIRIHVGGEADNSTGPGGWKNSKYIDQTISLSLPGAGDLGKTGKSWPVGAVLYFGNIGNPPSAIIQFQSGGYAITGVTPGAAGVSTGDTRHNQVWRDSDKADGRGGLYYSRIAPYHRDDLNSEIANALLEGWGVSNWIDALEKVAGIALSDPSVDRRALPNPQAIKMGDIIDPSKLGIYGYSWAGKYAFIAGVFDERIGVVMPGAAGATGPEPWRLGSVDGIRIYSWGVSAGMETINQSYRHNRPREVEFFSRFLNPWDFYVYKGRDYAEPDKNGDLAQGGATRLPFDQHELVASLWPRAIIEINTVNDYSDGAEADAISLQAAQAVYRYLGNYQKVITPAGIEAVSGDLIKFNYRDVIYNGDPHGGIGTDTGIFTRAVQYMDWYFYGKTMPGSTAAKLNTDPFVVDTLVPGGSNAYERIYGGLLELAPWGDEAMGGAPSSGRYFDGINWAGKKFSDNLTPESTIEFGADTVTLRGYYWTFLEGINPVYPPPVKDYGDYEKTLPYRVNPSTKRAQVLTWQSADKTIGRGFEIYALNGRLEVQVRQHAPFNRER